jgi:protein-disulfide isomerase
MNSKKWIIGFAVFSLLAFIAGTLVYKKTETKQAEIIVATTEAISNEQLIKFHSPALGAENPKVTIVEFFDPACEGCRAFYPVVKQIMAKYPNDVRL